jgi:hypothetical protein
MAEVQSPQVITREIDLSAVAPSISSTITAMVGGAVRGKVNEATFVSSPTDFIDKFGEPTTSSYLGYAAINFLREGNQLWVNRVASLAGDDPVATATTDTDAEIISRSITSFPLSGQTKFRFDNDQTASVSWNTLNSIDIDAIVETLNSAFAAFEPKLGSARVDESDPSAVAISTQSQDGPFSRIQVVSDTTSGGIFAGLEAVGERTVFTETSLTAAQLPSKTIVSGTVDTTVTNANVTGFDVTTATTNVSKLGAEAFGIIAVNSSGLNEGTYNSLTIQIAAVPDNADTLNFGLRTLSFRNGVAPTNGNHIVVTNRTTAQVAQAIADHVNGRQDYTTTAQEGANPGIVEGTPAFGVRAQAIGDSIIFTQINPDASDPVEITATYAASPASNFAVSNDISPSGALPDGVPVLLSGGTTGDYVKVLVPNTVVNNVVEVGTAISTGTTPANPGSNSGTYAAYYFMAGADFVGGGAQTVTQIAESLKLAIKNKGAWFPNNYSFSNAWDGTGGADRVHVGQKYALSSTNTANQVKITTNLVQQADGNDIQVDLTGVTSAKIVSVDLAAVSPGEDALSHGFDARPTYAFGGITIDGITYNINFDSDVSRTVVPRPQEATMAQVAAGVNEFINSQIGKTVADLVAAVGFKLRVTSPTAGSAGSATFSASVNGDANDPLDSGFIVTAGSGDNTLSFRINETFTVDVSFTQDSALSMTTVASEINAAAKKINSSLSAVASVNTSGTVVTITSPTKGSFVDFGSSVLLTDTFVPISGAVFNDVTIKEGTGDKVASIKIDATSPGTWANGKVEVQFVSENSLFFAPNSSTVNVFFNGRLVETFREVVVNPSADGTKGTTGQGVFIEDAINGVSDFITVDFDDDLLDVDPDTLIDSVKIVQNSSSLGTLPPYGLFGGADGLDALGDAEVIGQELDPVTGTPTGLQVFSDPEQIFINILTVPGFTSQAVGNAMVALAESRQDTIAILDPPIGLSSEQVVDWHNGLGFGRSAALNTSFAATYNTWITTFDPFNNVELDVPPSVFVAAQFAFNDKVSEPWFAVAGLNRGRLTSALDLLNPPKLGQRELLYGQGNAVNPIAKFRQEGIVIWGQKTLLRTESALNRINVRRMLNFAKVTIGLAAKVILFEPNDQASLTALLNLINPVLSDIQRRRGLIAFSVQDATTLRDRDLNRARINIFLQPTKTIEVIEIPFVVTSQGGSFTL